MKISYPIRDKDGKAFRSLDEIMPLIDAEAHGTWLLGGNGLWHGAVHISEVSNPRSALTPDTLSTGEPVPLQFMADGTIVAYRINNDYLKGPYKGQELRYSSTFVLVKSQCQPDPKNEKSWLEFYSLYMHLAPVKDYPTSCCYKVRDGHSGILLRKYTEGENGLPDGQEEGDAQQYKVPASVGRSLNEKGCFVSSRTGRFYVTKRSGEATLTTFGLVRVVKDGKMEEKQHWVTLDPTLMEPDGEIQALMPAWMQKAKERGVFDSVQTVEDTAEWKVSAGTPVGFMGCEEYPGRESAQAEREWFVHLEVLSADTRMPAFLGNPEGVKGEKRTVLAPKGRLLYTRQTTAGQETFTATSATLGAQCILPREATMPVTDESTQWWFNITGSGWLPEKDVAEAGQYDLLKLGFQPLVENSGGDMVRSPYEGWVPEAFDSVSRAAEQGDEWYEQVLPFYRDLMAEVDSNHDGKVTEEEIRQALVVRDPLVRNVVNRLVIKHHSEWYGGRSTGRWEGFYKDLDTEETAYCEKWQTDLEWMSGVSPFNTDEPVWHFHPVVFLEAIKQELDKQVIFPLTVKPENDPGHIWSHYDWRNMHQSNMAAYGTNRNGGARKHAARDLYTKPYEKVVAICDGIVLDSRGFYCKTNQVTIKHLTNDGRSFLIRYGELDPDSIQVRINDSVKQGQIIGKTGKLLEGNNTPSVIRNGRIVFMLHFEFYAGRNGLNISSPLTDTSRLPYQRRSDLEDPLPILDEGYKNTFPKNDFDQRVNINELTTSKNGSSFIKAWEHLNLETYNDSHGHCTIGYGHLIDKDRCENISIPLQFQTGLTVDSANLLFDSDLVRFEQGVKNVVSVKLYQHEFDALVSLLFNCGESFFRLGKAPLLIDSLNREDYSGVAEQFLDITNGGEDGLVKRRNAEYNIFREAVYNAEH
ncbi:peptidoglycan DD-metalloendopeptidase family protein [Citrobacter freundii]|uniref:glycoside hydrolase family protein n=1 Tax=Citrobacter freundii TaxID=546 RepID=UPI0015E9AEA7|nr:peptidoglycan DD-metalloendopeptidase family protein [Citrobacter freundii]QLY59673.1 peptidoglycan DD-metalloendopeptidase family protein [Citrobacter freundii]